MIERIFLLGFLILLLNGCAKTSLPQGGPEDKTAPTIVGYSIKNESVNFPLTGTIRFDFSENIKVFEEYIFISPPDPEFDVKIGRRYIEVKPEDSLLSNTTYVISFSSKITDLRSNSFTKDNIFAFSTGVSIDSQYVEGKVFDENFAPAFPAAVLLWKFPFDSLRTPDYITWTDSTGFYRQSYMAAGKYLVAATEKLLPDNKIDIEKRFAVASDTVDLNHKSAAGVNLVYTEGDTAAVYIKLFEQNDNYSFDIVFSQDVRINDLSYRFVPDIPALYPISVSGWTNRLHFFSDEKLKPGQYYVDLKDLTDGKLNTLDIDSFAFSIRSLEDTLPPKVIFRYPSDRGSISEWEKILVRFGKPISNGKITVNGLSIDVKRNDTLENAEERVFSDTTIVDIEGESEIIDRYTISFIFDENINLSTMRFMVKDVISKDNVRYSDTSWTNFSMIAKTKGELLVKIMDFAPCDDLILAINSTGKIKKSYLLQPTDSGYVVSDVDAGDFMLYAFCDDGDSTFYKGSLIPLNFSEDINFYPDTVNIRSKWVTEINW